MFVGAPGEFLTSTAAAEGPRGMQLGWERVSELVRLPVELVAHTHTDSWALKLALAWIASPLVCFVCFVLMRRLQKNQRLAPIVLAPAPGTATTADGSQADLRVAALNMCLLPGGWSFSGRYLLDGDDKKEERIERLLAMMEDYDVLLLNEMWGCWWSSLHTRFFQRATERGFYVCYSRVGASTPPLAHACSMSLRGITVGPRGPIATIDDAAGRTRMTTPD